SFEDRVNNTGSESVTNEVEIAGVSEVSLDNLENTELTGEENMPNDLLALLVSELNEEEYTPKEVSDMFDSQDSNLAIDDGHFYTYISDEDAGSPLPDEKQHKTPANTYADSNSMNLMTILLLLRMFLLFRFSRLLFQRILIYKWTSMITIIKTNVTSEAAKVRNSNCIETRQPERLSLTRKAYAPHSTSMEYTLKTQLLRIEMHDDETPDAYLNRAQEYANALAAISEPVKDKALVMLVVSGLHEEYNGLKTTITARQSPTAFSKLHALLSDHDYILGKTR
nr:nucleotide-binding, alpha-beta plait [Tanacetum cinerariifolium]